jgi:hypothetical protein
MKFITRALVALFATVALYPAFADLTTLQAGATSQQLSVRAVVQSTGAPDTALAYNTSGLSCSYQRPGAAVTGITLATQTVTGAYSSGGFVHLANGWYRLDVPDAAIASGVPFALVTCAATGDTFVDGRVSLSPAVNTVAIGGTTQTARDIGASVLLSAGTGTGQLDFTSGVVKSNMTQLLGTAAATPATAGILDVNVKNIDNDAASASGTVTFPNATLASTTNITAGTIATVTNLTNLPSIPADWITAAGITNGALTEAKFDTTAGSFKPLGVVDQGTAQAATSTTIQLRSALAMADSTPIGMTVLACGSTQGYCQSRAITAYTGATDTATVATWDVTPSGTITYYLFGTAPGSSGGGLDAAGVRAAVGLSAANLDTQLSTINGYVDTEVAAIKTKTDFLPSATAGAAGGLFIAGTNAATSITTGLTANITGNLSGSVGSVTTVSDKTGYTLSNAGIDAFADRSTTGHTTAGTWGGAWNAAGSSGDPWTTNLPGAYGAGTAGYILGTNLNATMSSRMATFTLPTNFSSLAITGGGAVTAGTVSDKTGYSLSQTFPTNFSSLSIDGSGRTLLQPTQTGVTIPTVTTLTNAPSDSSGVTTLLSRVTAAVPTAVQISAQLAADQRILTGTCSSGSTTTCVDAALTQAAAAQLQDRLICFDDSWCGLITTFTPGTDTVTTTKVAPSTRASKAYTIYPSTAQ